MLGTYNRTREILSASDSHSLVSEPILQNFQHQMHAGSLGLGAGGLAGGLGVGAGMGGMSYRALLGEINGSKSSTNSMTRATVPVVGDGFKTLVAGETGLDMFNKSKSLASASVTTGSNRDNVQSKDASAVGSLVSAPKTSNSKESSLVAVPRSENDSRPSSKKSVTFHYDDTAD